MVFAFSTLGFWWRSGGALVAPRGLLVEWIGVALPHAVPGLVLFALRCFALHALRSSRCMGFAFPRCAVGGDGLDDTGDKANHGAIP